MVSIVLHAVILSSPDVTLLVSKPPRSPARRLAQRALVTEIVDIGNIRNTASFDGSRQSYTPLEKRDLIRDILLESVQHKQLPRGVILVGPEISDILCVSHILFVYSNAEVFTLNVVSCIDYRIASKRTCTLPKDGYIKLKTDLQDNGVHNKISGINSENHLKFQLLSPVMVADCTSPAEADCILYACAVSSVEQRRKIHEICLKQIDASKQVYPK
jgi:hypothetical protein